MMASTVFQHHLSIEHCDPKTDYLENLSQQLNLVEALTMGGSMFLISFTAASNGGCESKV